MYICLCQGITDAQIRHCINSGATSLKEVRRELGVASQCCKCLPEAKVIVEDALKAQQQEPQQNGVTTILPPPLFFPA